MTTLFDLHLVDDAIELLQAAEPKDAPYWGCFSGGKDSCVIKELARLAGVKVEWHYNVTSVDPPELVYFIRKHHPDVIFDKPKMTMWQLIEREGFPMARRRHCCRILKEYNGKGRVKILGIRWEESLNRRNSWDGPVSDRGVCPILKWNEADVWEFIESHGLPYCKLYDEGFSRIGCIACPQAPVGQRKRDLARWPTYEAAYRRAFKRLWDRKHDKWAWGNYFLNSDELFDWWLSRSRMQNVDDMALFAGGNE